MQRLVLCCGVLCAAAATVSAQTLVADPDGLPLGTDLSHHFPGLTLSVTNAGEPTDWLPIVIDSPLHGAPDRAIGHNDGGDSGYFAGSYYFEGDLDQGAWNISLDVGAIGSVLADFTLIAYGPSGEIGRDHIPAPGFDWAPFTLSVSADGPDISSFFLIGGRGGAAAVEQIRWTVPSPAAGLVLLGGCSLIGARRRR